MTTCSIPDCEEPPTDETTMWAIAMQDRAGFPTRPKEVLVVSLPVCAAHKRENETHE